MPLLTLILTLLAGLLFAVPATALQYDRAAVDAGELWRLVTCQFTHWSLDHLLWDVIVFAALGVICEREGRRSFVATIITASVAVPIAVHLTCRDITTFRGLSGIDSALFGLLLGRLFIALRDRRSRWICTAAAVAFVAKCAWEHLAGVSVFVDAGETFVVVPLSHAVGFVCGVALACGDAMFPWGHVAWFRPLCAPFTASAASRFARGRCARGRSAFRSASATASGRP